MKLLGSHQRNSNTATIRSGKACHNLQNGVINVNVNEGKENICPSLMKKHHTTVAGTDLFAMLTAAISKVDPTTNNITLMQPHTQFLELAEQ
jgi:hypothetical protein